LYISPKNCIVSYHFLAIAELLGLLNVKKRKLELTENVSRQLEKVESLLAGIGRFNTESFRTSRLPLLNLPADVLEVLRSGQLEYTKARAIARVGDEQTRKQLLEDAIAYNLSLNEIKRKMAKIEGSCHQVQPCKVL
jgi:ParB family chromosome partitioning protein